MKKIISLLIFIFITSNLYSQSKPDYPQPEEGYKRVDLMLPKSDNHKNKKVEIRFGITVNVVECATASFILKTENIKQKFGITGSRRYPYYNVESSNGDISVGMPEGCDSKSKIEKTALSTSDIFIEYQSYYPIPFYIPKDWTLEYRVWETNDTYTTINK